MDVVSFFKIPRSLRGIGFVYFLLIDAISREDAGHCGVLF